MIFLPEACLQPINNWLDFEDDPLVAQIPMQHLNQMRVSGQEPIH